MEDIPIKATISDKTIGRKRGINVLLFLLLFVSFGLNVYFVIQKSYSTKESKGILEDEGSTTLNKVSQKETIAEEKEADLARQRKIASYDVVSFISPTDKYSVNIWFDEEGNSYGNVVDNDGQWYVYSSIDEHSVSIDSRTFSNLSFHNTDGGFETDSTVDGFVRWLDEDTFVLRKEDGLHVVSIEYGGSLSDTVLRSPVDGYDTLDIDKDSTILLLENKLSEGPGMLLYDLVEDSIIDIEINSSARISEYDYFTDKFIFYPSNINEIDAQSNDVMLFDPASKSVTNYFIPISEGLGGRGCGGWHLISDEIGVLKIDDQCEPNFTKSKYINEDGHIEIPL